MDTTVQDPGGEAVPGWPGWPGTREARLRDGLVLVVPALGRLWANHASPCICRLNDDAGNARKPDSRCVIPPGSESAVYAGVMHDAYGRVVDVQGLCEQFWGVCEGWTPHTCSQWRAGPHVCRCRCERRTAMER